MKFLRFIKLFILYFIYFLDLGGVAIALILFSNLITSADSHFLTPALVDNKNLIYGTLLACYPFMQFISAPLFGELSDHYGRKNILLISTFGTTVSFAFSAFAIWQLNLPLLYCARILSGLFAGNVTIAQASISDFVPEHQRARYMAIFAMLSGAAWAVFPFLGSLLLTISYALPFIVMSFCFFACFCLLHLFERTPARKRHAQKFFQDFALVFKKTNLAPLLLIGFLALFAWLMNQGFNAPYLTERYNLAPERLGEMLANAAIFSFLGGLVANQFLFKKSNPFTINTFFIPFLTLGLGVRILWGNPEMSWITGAMGSFSFSIVLACFFSIFSEMASKDMQGKVFGIWNGAMGLGGSITPILGGWLSRFYLKLPFIVAFCFLLLSSCLYARWYTRHYK